MQACIVLALGEEGEDKHLVAYLVPNEGATKKLIRANLKRNLPFWMVMDFGPVSVTFGADNCVLTPVKHLGGKCKAIVECEEIAFSAWFLVACYVTLHPALSVRWSIGPLVRWSVGPSVRRSVRHTLLFFAVFGLTAPAQIMKWPQLWPLPTRTWLGYPCIQPCSSIFSCGHATL